MTVTNTTLGAGVIRTYVDQSANISAALRSASSTPANSATANATSSVSGSYELATSTNDSSTQALALKADSLNISYAGTQLDTVGQGAQEVSGILNQLQSLATLASVGGLTESARAQLNGQFQALRASINNVPPQPPGSEYDGADLLQSVGLTAGSSNTGSLVVGGFTDTAILGGADQTLLSQDGATQALAAVASGQQKIGGQLETIASLQQSVDFAASSVDVALQNHEAASSSLSEEDLGGSAAVSLQASLQASPDVAKNVQTGRLPDGVLQLLS